MEESVLTLESTQRRRRSIRLKDYDYTQAGAYFITICVQARTCLFGEIVDEAMQLNDAGLMIQQIWDELPVFYPGTDIDAFVVMPNHIHGIVLVGAAPRGRPHAPDGRAIAGQPGPPQPGHPPPGQPQGVAPTLPLPDGGQGQSPSVQSQPGQPSDGGQPMSLADVVHRFKTMTIKRYVDGVKQGGWPPFPGRLWQRNYFDHIIRDEESLNRIRQYIAENPARWEFDKQNPLSRARRRS